MKLTRKLPLTLILCLLFAAPSSAFALGLGFGAKLGLGNGLPEDDDAGDISITAGYLVANLNLMAVAVEGNIGLIRGASDDLDDTYSDELSVVALVKTGIPIIPAVLSLDFGAGIDQRILMGTTVGDKELDDVSGNRTLIPLSIQASGTILLARVYGEVRYNHEIAGSYEIDGVEADTKKVNELLFLVGATF
ncbi:MAG: hypothetical protein ACPGQS_12830 [Bradymonadia bacterium]